MTSCLPRGGFAYFQCIWNFPSTKEDPGADEILGLRNDYAGRPVVATVGGLGKEKGLKVSLDTASIVQQKYPDVLFVFIGWVTDGSDELADLIQRRGLERNVRFLDSMPYRSMLAHLHYANVGLALYQNEWHYGLAGTGQGRRFFSYMLAGLPIIGPVFGQIGRSVTMADCGVLVDTGSAHDVACAVMSFLDDPEYARRTEANGRRAFAERFNWEAAKGDFLRFIYRVEQRR